MKNLPIIFLKVALLATIIFWTLLYILETETYSFWLILFITVPIFIVCTGTITFTILPFYWLSRDTLSKKKLFQKYFPYYAIVCFGICYFALQSFEFEPISIVFFTTAFISSLQAWVWLFKTNNHDD